MKLLHLRSKIRNVGILRVHSVRSEYSENTGFLLTSSSRSFGENARGDNAMRCVASHRVASRRVAVRDRVCHDRTFVRSRVHHRIADSYRMCCLFRPRQYLSPSFRVGIVPVRVFTRMRDYRPSAPPSRPFSFFSFSFFLFYTRA